MCWRDAEGGGALGDDACFAELTMEASKGSDVVLGGHHNKRY